jgi:hypothetical protein
LTSGRENRQGMPLTGMIISQWPSPKL